MPLEVLIGADFLPNSKTAYYFRKKNLDSLIGKKLVERLKTADYILLNLEGPLCDGKSPIDKCGPCLYATVDTIEGIKAINPYFFTLANNHILDYGADGLASTLKCLDAAGIAYAGAGENQGAASKPHFFEKNGIRVGVYCCAEHEFSIATATKPGANPFDPYESYDHVTSLKNECDHVIVLYHGGKEYYRYPSPELQKRCRKFVDKGASLVVCQHTHCCGCEEKWKDGTIIYGQGNFLFGLDCNEYTGTSVLVDLVLEKDKCSIKYIPIEKTDVGVVESDSGNIVEAFLNRSREIENPGFIENEYMEFAKTHLAGYLLTFLAKGRNSLFTRALNKLSGHRYVEWLIKHRYDKDLLLGLENRICCEAHRELIVEGIVNQRRRSV